MRNRQIILRLIISLLRINAQALIVLINEYLRRALGNEDIEVVVGNKDIKGMFQQ